MPSFTNVLNNLANNGRDSLLTPQEVNNRKTVSNRCSVVEVCAVAAIVTSVAIAIFSVIFLGPILATLCVVSCAAIAIFSYDVYVVANNVKNVIDECLQELSFRLLNSENDRIMHLLKGTIIVKPITKLIFKMTS